MGNIPYKNSHFTDMKVPLVRLKWCKLYYFISSLFIQILIYEGIIPLTLNNINNRCWRSREADQN